MPQFKYGDLRSDGFRFYRYKKLSGGRLQENWCSPSAWEKVLARARKFSSIRFQRNADKIRKTAREKYHKSEEFRAAKRKNFLVWAKNNSEKYKSSYSSWKRANLGKVFLYNAKRRSKLSCAGLNKEDVGLTQVFYEISERVSSCTGVKHHVDHIVPLSRGGRHAPSNLQVLPATLNLRKSNRVS